MQIYVKANFNYNPKDDKFIPTPDVGLEFQKGDILRILNQDETHWWQVRIYRILFMGIHIVQYHYATISSEADLIESLIYPHALTSLAPLCSLDNTVYLINLVVFGQCYCILYFYG